MTVQIGSDRPFGPTVQIDTDQIDPRGSVPGHGRKE